MLPSSFLADQSFVLSPRHIITASGRAVRYAVYFLIAGFVLFFALTRTEVGREGLRLQLERQFAERYDGRLEIGVLKGNLLNRLSAGDVRILDSAGRTVISADSIIAHPSWQDLLDRTVSTGRITLIRPKVHLGRAANGTWNLAAIFSPDRSPGGAGDWSFSSAHLTIIDGHFSTRSNASAPAAVRENYVFDYLNSDLRDVNGHAVVDWQPGLRFIDILQLNARLEQPDVNVDSLRGQFLLEAGELHLNEVYARLGATDLHLAGSLSSPADPEHRPTDPHLDLDLRPSILHADELTRIFPKLPMASALTASMRVRGPLSALVLEDLLIAHGGSHVAAEGTFVGLPDSVDYDFAILPGVVQWRDVDAVYTGPHLPSLSHLGAIHYSGFAAGILRLPGDAQATHIDAADSTEHSSRPHAAGEPSEYQLTSWEGTAEIHSRSLAGAVAVDVQHAITSSAGFAVEGVLHADSLNVGMILQDDKLVSRLNGRAAFQASGTELSNISGDLTASLSRSRLANRIVDTLAVELASDDGSLSARLTAAQGAGRLQAYLRAFSGGDLAAFELSGSLSRFDVGPAVLSDSIASSLNLDFELEGTAAAMHDFEGTGRLVVDSSFVAYGRNVRPVAPHQTTFVVRQTGSTSPVVEIGGDLIRLRVTGDVAIDPFVRLVRHWSDAVRQSTSDAVSKPFRPVSRLSETAPPRPPGNVLQLTPHYESAVVELEQLGWSQQTLSADLKVLRSDILSALLPALPVVQTDLSAQIDLRFNADTVRLHTSAFADSVIVEGKASHDLDARILIEGALADVFDQTFSAELHVTSDRFRWSKQHFTAVELTGLFENRTLKVLVQSDAQGAADPLRLDARLDLHERRNRIHLTELQLPARDQTWRADGDHVIDLYEDAVVVNEVIIRRTDAGSRDRELIRFRGTLSEQPSDTLLVDVREVQLRDVLTLLSEDVPFDGTMDGRLAYTGFTRRPELTGAIRIHPLAYDARVLGTVDIDSRYIPGSPDVGLQVRVSPASPLDTNERSYEENDLSISGTFRLPGFGSRFPDAQGALNLRLDVARLDAFFLEHIFAGEIEGVEGYFAGNGRIYGTFWRPLFDADLRVRNAGFRIPEFNLDYTLEGGVRVDASGIHLDDVAVTDATDGRALVSGSILFNEYRYFSFDLKGDLEELRIMNVARSRDLPFYGRIWTSGHVTLTGPLSNALLRADDAVAASRSNLYIPVSETIEATDSGFIVFADSAGNLPDIQRLTRRPNVLAERPEGERPFLEGLEMNLNITAPEGSTVHLVIDPLLGDEINAVGQGRIELIRAEGEFFTFGTFDVDSGDYLFTAGDVFYRRFLIDDGSIRWDGDPLNPTLDIHASYRTRASTEGLIADGESRLIPLIIRMNVLGRVTTPGVELSLAVDRSDRRILDGYEGIEAELNQPDLAAQYATSVLLTNSFLLTTSSLGSQQHQGLTDTRNQLAFNSLSQLVASQLNRYLNYALPNLDLNLGLQGESAQDLDVTYGVALRLLDERLIIRGRGIYRNEPTDAAQQQSGLDEFVVEVRLNPNVSVEMFYRREGDLLSASESFNTSTGAGLSYQTQFASWDRFVRSAFGWLFPGEPPPSVDDPEEDETEDESDGTGVVAGASD